VPLVTLDDGSRLRLAEIGQVRDGFEDKNFENWFNGGRGIFLSVYQMGDEKPLDVARAVHEYIETIEPTLPEGVGISVLRDRAAQYESRLDLLLRNGAIGLGLVLLVLGLFLKPRLAFWVAVSVPTTLMGALLILPLLGASINMISLFAF